MYVGNVVVVVNKAESYSLTEPEKKFTLHWSLESYRKGPSMTHQELRSS